MVKRIQLFTVMTDTAEHTKSHFLKVGVKIEKSILSDTVMADKVYVYGSEEFYGFIRTLYGDDAVKIACNRGVDGNVYKISFFGSDGRTVEPSSLGLRQFYNRNGWEEYISAISDKGAALSDLMMRLSVLKSEVASAGDDMSDLPMLKRSGRAYAFTGELASALGIGVTHDPTEIFTR